MERLVETVFPGSFRLMSKFFENLFFTSVERGVTKRRRMTGFDSKTKSDNIRCQNG